MPTRQQQARQERTTPARLPPEPAYRHLLAAGTVSSDPAQEMAIAKLQKLYDDLQARPGAARRGWLDRIVPAKRRALPVKGLYLWGGVGRGKTFLMDTFFESLPPGRKMRVHFHRFMQRIHQELKRQHGQKDPLDKVAATLAEEAEVLCFDEFFVTDITDAMILGTLLRGLFERGVTLVATSNIEPEGLYENGLQRERFLPAIALLRQYTEVVNVDNGIDYRLRVLARAELYHTPLDIEADRSLERSFDSLVHDAPCQCDSDIEIEGRPIRVRCLADGVAWFDFRALCDGPRSQNDYIELARIFHTVLVSGVPCFDGNHDDQARRFINLVDEFYDRNVKLLVSAEAPPTELYRGGGLAFPFQRTASRLQEMQSHDYLARRHEA